MPVYNPETGAPRTPRLPRLGIIRLGFKESRFRNDGQEYSFPRAADHFVLDDAPAVAEVFGAKPVVLDPLVIPGEDEEIVASHWLRTYSITWGLTCIGDGRTANRRADRAILERTGEAQHATHSSKETIWTPVTCPCPLLESGECRETMYLRFVLPTVPGLGVWQISTGSSNSIKNIQGTLAMLRSMTGRISGHLLKLSLVEQEVFSDQGGRKTVRILRLDPCGSMSIMDMLKNVKALGAAPFLSPIEVVPPEEEAGPDDVEESGRVIPPEVEEAGYLTKVQLQSGAESVPPARSDEAHGVPGQSLSPRPPRGGGRAPAAGGAAAPAPNLQTTSDLFRACWEQFNLQPAQVVNMAGYGRPQDLEGQDLNRIFIQVRDLAAHTSIEGRP